MLDLSNCINLIFDFDGTLVDSFPRVIEQFNHLAGELEFQAVEPGQINELRNLSSKELIQNFKIPLHRIPQVILKIRERMRAEIPHLQTFEGMPAVLQELQKRDINLGILTSNSLENVREWLRLQEMQQVFQYIHVESGYFGKKRLLNKLIKSYRMDKSQTFYIGDETRDIEAAKGAEIHSVAVTWGFNTEKILLQQEPDYVLRKPEDILMLLG